MLKKTLLALNLFASLIVCALLLAGDVPSPVNAQSKSTQGKSEQKQVQKPQVSTTQSGGWASETLLGGTAKSLIVTSNADGRLEIFYIGTDDKLYHNFQDPQGPNGWYGPIQLGGIAKSVAVGRNQDGRLEVFYIGAGNLIYHNWQL